MVLGIAARVRCVCMCGRERERERAEEGAVFYSWFVVVSQLDFHSSHPLPFYMLKISHLHFAS